jgi:hypothetical protein
MQSFRQVPKNMAYYHTFIITKDYGAYEESK